MRKTTKLVGGCMVAALVAMFAVLPAAGASASSSVLNLKSGGSPVANGSTGVLGLTMASGSCNLDSNGTVVANGAKTDVVTATSSSNEECPVGESISGLIKEVSLKAKNPSKAKITGSITYTHGECVYAFSKFKATPVAVPGFTLLEGTAKGKLTAGSKTACPKLTEKFDLDITNEVFGEPFQTELAA